MLDKWDNNQLEFTPTCPRSIYNIQIAAMADYIAVLKVRAVMEGVELLMSREKKTTADSVDMEKIQQLIRGFEKRQQPSSFIDAENLQDTSDKNWLSSERPGRDYTKFGSMRKIVI